MPFINESKSSSPTWQKYLRRGATPTLGDMADFRFLDSISEDGDPALDDATFASLEANSIVWTNQNKS